MRLIEDERVEIFFGGGSNYQAHAVGEESFITLPFGVETGEQREIERVDDKERE